MLLGGIALGLVLGLLAGGSLANLARIQLRWPALLFVAVIVRFGTEAALEHGLAIVDALRLPLLAGAYGILLAGLWANRSQPGLRLAFVGVLSNAIVTTVNGGRMPIWEPALYAAGFTPADLTSSLHFVLPARLDATFLLRLGPLGDVVPIPFPVVQNVASIGDLFLSAGLAFFLFASVLPELDEAAPTGPAEEPGRGRLARHLQGIAAATRLPRTLESVLRRGVRPETGLGPGLAEAAALERPLVLAGAGAGLAAPALAPLPVEAAAVEVPAAVAVPRPPAVLERARRHPYVRLALNSSFSALWVGQLISLFGDRVHQVALAFLVLALTDSAVAVALVFVAATIPNLFLGPVAGTLVDRWDHKEVLVVSDLLRAAVVLLMPVAATIDVRLLYPLVFLVTSISLFFRPARVAIVPRIVRQDELLAANSATWIGETLADIVGYPLAGLFVAFLGTALPLAFWFDAATYVGSAVLIATVAAPPVARAAGGAVAASGLLGELRAGWEFLRRETVLLANTIQGAIGQFSVGVILALTPLYARDAIDRAGFDATAAYAFLETGIGLGNLLGGFLVGLIGARLARGRLIIAGYSLWGAAIALLAVAGHLWVALGLMTGLGVANMIAIIPSQTLFQERTPPDLIGRVVGFRFAVVFGSMTIAMAASGVLAEVLGVAAVIGAFGLVTLAAGVAGLFVRSVREA